MCKSPRQSENLHGLIFWQVGLKLGVCVDSTQIQYHSMPTIESMKSNQLGRSNAPPWLHHGRTNALTSKQRIQARGLCRIYMVLLLLQALCRVHCLLPNEWTNERGSLHDCGGCRSIRTSVVVIDSHHRLQKWQANKRFEQGVPVSST